MLGFRMGFWVWLVVPVEVYWRTLGCKASTGRTLFGRVWGSGVLRLIMGHLPWGSVVNTTVDFFLHDLKALRTPSLWELRHVPYYG